MSYRLPQLYGADDLRHPKGLWIYSCNNIMDYTPLTLIHRYRNIDARITWTAMSRLKAWLQAQSEEFLLDRTEFREKARDIQKEVDKEYQKRYAHEY